MTAVTLNCPSCGAGVELKHRFMKLAVCEFCQQGMVITREGADPTGKTAALSSFGSILKLNARGTIDGRAFLATGRLRFEYDDGYWDEWYLMFDDGGDGWLVEDEGDLTLAQKEHHASGIPPYSSFRVGAKATVAGRTMVVTERGEAEIVGGEGQLPMFVRPGETVRYVDGKVGKQGLMIEYTEDGAELSLATPVDEDDIEVEEDFA